MVETYFPCIPWKTVGPSASSVICQNVQVRPLVVAHFSKNGRHALSKGDGFALLGKREPMPPMRSSRLLHHLVDAPGQSDDLWPILVNKALRMSQAIAQTLDLLAGTTRRT